MPIGTLSIRIDDSNERHHLFRNGRLWWIHFTVHHSGFKKHRARLPLGTASLPEAINRRDALFAQVQREGYEIPVRQGTAA